MRLTVCLSLLVLLMPLPSGAQSSADQQAAQAVPAPAANTDATTANTPGDSDSSATATAGSDYILGSEDEINIEVLNVPELKLTVRVASDGNISVPLIGRVPASGLTPEQLRQELEEKWGENYLPLFSIWAETEQSLFQMLSSSDSAPS